METLQYGAYQAINTCLRVQPNERVIIISDLETIVIGRALETEARKVTPAVQLYTMEEFGERPEDGSNPLPFPQTIADAMRTADVSIYAAQGKKGELASFRKPMFDTIHSTPSLRHAHMISITEKLMREGMGQDYGIIQKITKRIYDIASTTKEMHVTTPAGTDLRIELGHRWKISDGIIDKPGMWSNLPDGETYSAAKNANGMMVVDGVLGDHFSEKYGLLDAHPVHITVKDGRAVKVSCTDKQLEQEFWAYLHTDENSDRFAEVAIGTAIGLRGLVGNLLQDEKYPGNHNAFGDPYARETGAPWESSTHVDGVMRDCTIALDGRTIMRGGKFVDDILRD